MIPKPFAPLFTGSGRRYWGRYSTSCLVCWNEHKGIVPDTPEMGAFFRRAEHCELCAGTQRDAIPWSELFRAGPRFDNSYVGKWK